ncbi:Z1 domain-containing protein [Nostoc sp.]|uniref:Z1 domain-containing protein n=2 Tax=unclassified Nostoc TaxID=2593658 RepID=UPI003006F884
MSKMDIITDGYCINKVIDKVKSKIGDKAAEQLKQTAVEVVQNCVHFYSITFGSGDVGATGTGFVSQPHKGKIADGTTGLIYGKVQSGKTNTTIATLALAQANHFRCFIVLTSDNTCLGEQTADRFAEQLKGGPRICNWKEWRNDPEDFATNQLLDYMKDTGVVLVSTKNKSHLDNLLKVLKYSKASSVPTLIFDDEADNASPNTNEAKQAKKGKETVPDSAIFEKIGNIRKEVGNHIYLQITATPQSLLLQNINHPCKPVFCAALPQPGDSYIGGNLFFSDNSKYCCTKVELEELDQLKKQGGKINPGNNWDIPPGLRLSLCCFFLGSIYKIESAKNSEAKYSFLAHIDHKRITHSTLEKVIRGFIAELDKALRGKLSAAKREEAMKWLNQAYTELSETAKNLPPLNDLVIELEHELRNAIPKVIDASNPDKGLKYSSGMNILIGGNRLGRGVTIEGLMITYYGRDAKQKTMDTVHQHARMFGYRQELLDVTRLFLPQHILEDFRAIHEADEGMRQAIGDDPNNIQITPVWVGPTLKATRSNVLNLAAINAFIPGSHIFPRAPLWKASEIRKDVEELDKLLASYETIGEKGEYHEVEIDFLIKIISCIKSHYWPGYPWQDDRVKDLLVQMKTQDISKGRLNVVRGKTGKGLELTRQEPSAWGGFGFINARVLNKPKTEYPNVPTLLLMYEKGENKEHWDNQPLYLPTLILPKNKFVFMFNYSEAAEELEDDIDFQD